MFKIKRYIFTALFSISFSAFSADEGVVKATEKPPIGAELNLSNNVGAGTALSAYQQAPSIMSTLTVYPHFKIGPFLGNREVKIQLEASANLEWAGENNPFPGKIADKFGFNDLKLRSEFKRAINFADAGISLSPALEFEAPLSKVARIANRIIGMGGYINATWSKWGFFATYKPTLLGYLYTVPYKSDTCPPNSSGDDQLGGDVCKVAGRQTMALLKNGFFTGYSGGNHTVTLGFRTYHSLLRAPDSGEKPTTPVGSNVMEASLGMVEYAYNLPVSIPTSLALGLQSYQNPYDAAGSFRMPFFDFTEPAKNQTEAYVALNITI